MYTENEKQKMQKALEFVKGCSGDCINCKYMQMHFCEVGRNIYYVVECGKVPNFSGCELVKNLKTSCIEFLEFELS